MKPMRDSTVRATSFENLEGRRLLAATNLVLDAAGLLPADAVQAGGNDYFFANDGTHGRELWKSDGTAAGTSFVKDLTPGVDSSDGLYLTEANGKAIFFTRTATIKRQHVQAYNYTLWASDGTDDGTVAVQSFRNVIMVRTAETGDRAVFSIYTRDAAANEYSSVWSTDGTSAGTTKLKAFEMPASDGGSVLINQFFTAGDRAVFRVGSSSLYSTDGTVAGTIDISSAFSGVDAFDMLSIVSVDDQLLLFNDAGTRLWSTDGTIAGTHATTLSLPGRIDLVGGMPVVLNGQAYVVTAHSTGDPIIKDVYGVNIATGAATKIYTATGDASTHRIGLTAAGGGLIIDDADGDVSKGDSQLLVSDGTAAGTHVLVSGGSASELSSAVVGGVLYETRLIHTAGGGEGGLVGARTDSEGGEMLSGGDDNDVVELWRSDGTAAGTGRVSVLSTGTAKGNYAAYTLRAVGNKLALRTERSTYTPGQPISGDMLTSANTYTDSTEVYAPSELLPGREAAVARLVNGVLRIGGSSGDDRIIVYRRASDPEQLVVEYNGNTRVFATSDVTRIKADLQDGADYFELREGDEGFLRLRTSVSGGDGNDTIITASGRDTITGGAGNDRIYAGRGNDQVSGGSGNDRIAGQSGADQISGGDGRDRVTGGGGNDVLFGVNAVEAVFGQNAEGQSFLDDVLLT